MVRLVVAAVAAALLVQPAAADPPADDSRIYGGCSMHSVDDGEPDLLTPPDTYVGTVSARVVAYAVSSRHLPVTVTAVRCDLIVDGAVVETFHGTGAGPVGVVAPQVVQRAVPEDVVWGVCAVVTTRDAHGNVATHHEPWCLHTPVPLIPLWLVALLDDAFALFDDTVGPNEAAACAALAERRTGPGPVEIQEDGDVYAGGELVWDCPPYEWR